MAAVEPTAGRLANPFARYLLATRPAFLAAGACACLIGFASARYDGVPFDAALAGLTLLGALLVQAGVNVLNDYYDALSGADAANGEHLYPFTGGSRFIQNGVLSARATARYGVALLAVAALIGVALALTRGPGLWAIGAAGLFLGWAYSAPPLALASRRLGELSVAIGFGALLPLGADYVQRGEVAWLPVFAGLPYAALVAALLYINQFPDRRADELTGKRHWVVRLGARRARWGYALLVFAAYAILLLEVGLRVLPAAALIAALPAVLSIAAAREVMRHAETPAGLVPAIRLTIAAMVTHGLLLPAALLRG